MSFLKINFHKFSDNMVPEQLIFYEITSDADESQIEEIICIVTEITTSIDD